MRYFLGFMLAMVMVGCGDTPGFRQPPPKNDTNTADTGDVSEAGETGAQGGNIYRSQEKTPCCLQGTCMEVTFGECEGRGGVILYGSRCTPRLTNICVRL